MTPEALASVEIDRLLTHLRSNTPRGTGLPRGTGPSSTQIRDHDRATRCCGPPRVS
jgi:hypothetical protein